MRGIDQRTAGGGQILLIMEDALNARVAEGGPDTVAHQHETFALTQLAIQVIHYQMLIQAHSALEYMLHAGLFPHMVFAEALKRAVQPAVGTAIADVRQGKTPAAQDQCTQGGQQRLTAAIGLQPAVVRDQHTVQRLGDRPSFRGGVVIQGQGLQSGARRQAAVGALANAIGEGEQVALAGRQGRSRGDHANGVLIFATRAGGAGFAEGQLQGHAEVPGEATEEALR